MAQRGSKPPACAKCGRNHSGTCREGSTGCVKCCQNGHLMRECPKNKQGNGNKAQSSSVAPPYKVAPRGATQVLAEEQTAYMLSPVAKSKMIRQMLSLVGSKSSILMFLSNFLSLSVFLHLLGNLF